MWTNQLSYGGYDDDYEGYMALTISVVKFVPTETAFDVLCGKSINHIRRDPEWFVNEIDEMTKDGWKRIEIAEMMGVSPSNLTHIYNRYRKWLEESDE